MGTIMMNVPTEQMEPASLQHVEMVIFGINLIHIPIIREQKYVTMATPQPPMHVRAEKQGIPRTSVNQRAVATGSYETASKSAMTAMDSTRTPVRMEQAEAAAQHPAAMGSSGTRMAEQKSAMMAMETEMTPVRMVQVSLAQQPAAAMGSSGTRTAERRNAKMPMQSMVMVVQVPAHSKMLCSVRT